MDCIPASLIVGGVFDKFSKKDEVRGGYTSLTHVDSAAGGGDCESILDDGTIRQNQSLSQDGKLGVEYKICSENNQNMHQPVLRNSRTETILEQSRLLSNKPLGRQYQSSLAKCKVPHKVLHKIFLGWGGGRPMAVMKKRCAS
jgi:hypothetical protein